MNMNQKIMMSIIALAVTVTFGSAGMAMQTTATKMPAAAQKTVAAQKAPAQENWEKVHGVIQGVNEKTGEITVKTSREVMTFATDHATIISKYVYKMPFQSLKKGLSTVVEYQKEGNKLMAEWIWIPEGLAKPVPEPMIQAKATAGNKMQVQKQNPSVKAAESK
jgi:hypothetical protein